MQLSNMNVNDISETIKAMRGQEQKGYRSADYFLEQESNGSQPRGKRCLNMSVDDQCRFRMAQWCYEVVDFCKFDRDTVAIAMSYLDRFMSSPQGADALKDRVEFQLAAMTCLYTAIKIHEPEAMEPKVISNLSRGAYSAADVERMERKLLEGLQWRLNPPTALAFVHMFLTLIPKDLNMNEELVDASIDLAKYQSELAIQDYTFVGVDSSLIALAALANTLQITPSKLKYDFLKQISDLANIDIESEFFVAVREQLWAAMERTQSGHRSYVAYQSPTVAKSMGYSVCNSGSPRGVASPR